MSANYPSSVSSSTNLYTSVNGLQTVLGSSCGSSDVTLTLASTTGFPTVGAVTLDNSEVVFYTGISGATLTGCTRGADGTTATSHTAGVTVGATVVAQHHNSQNLEIIAIEQDLINAFGSVTPAGPNATDTNMKNRIASILQQIKTGFGLSNWYSTISAAMLSTAGGTMSGNIAMGGNSISGAADVGLASINSTFVGLGRNRILNGSMRFDQNKEGSAYTSSDHLAHYNLDQWRHEGTGSAVFSVQRLATGPNNFFTHLMQISTTTAATASHADGVNMEYPMDPVYQADWAWGTASAVPVTLQFWALCSKTGTFSLSFLSGVNDVSYVTTYTITAINTWQHFVFTIPGPTTGSWPTSGAVFGLKIVWDLGSGSDVTTSTLNAWQSGSLWRASGSNGVVESPGATLDLTGVQIEIGSTATAFEYLPYSLELLLLQRYFYKTFPSTVPCSDGEGSTGAPMYVAPFPGTTVGGGTYIKFPVEMVSIPVISTYTPQTGGGGHTNWSNETTLALSGSPTTFSPGPGGVFIKNPQVTADNGGEVFSIHMSASAQLGGA